MQIDVDFSLLAPSSTVPNFVELRGDVALADNGAGQVVCRNVSAGEECLAHYAADVALTPDMFVQAPIVQRGAPDIADLGVFLRKEPASPIQTGYLVTAFFRFNNQAQHTVVIYKCVAGVYQSLVSQTATLDPGTLYTLRGEVVTNEDGSVTIRALLGGATVVSVTDSTSPITAGKGAALRAFCSSTELLEWQRFTAGDLGPQPHQITWSAIASGSALGDQAVAAGPAIVWTSITSPAVRTVAIATNRSPQLVASTWAREKLSLLTADTLAEVASAFLDFDTPSATFTSVAPGSYRWKWRYVDATGAVEDPAAVLSDPFVVSQMGAVSVVTGAVSVDGRRIEASAIPAGSAMGDLRVFLVAPAAFHRVPVAVPARRRVRRP